MSQKRQRRAQHSGDLTNPLRILMHWGYKQHWIKKPHGVHLRVALEIFLFPSTVFKHTVAAGPVTRSNWSFYLFLVLFLFFFSPASPKPLSSHFSAALGFWYLMQHWLCVCQVTGSLGSKNFECLGVGVTSAWKWCAPLASTFASCYGINKIHLPGSF